MTDPKIQHIELGGPNLDEYTQEGWAAMHAWAMGTDPNTPLSNNREWDKTLQIEFRIEGVDIDFKTFIATLVRLVAEPAEQKGRDDAFREISNVWGEAQEAASEVLKEAKIKLEKESNKNG